MKKRLLALILSISLILGNSLAASAWAENTSEDGSCDADNAVSLTDTAENKSIEKDPLQEVLSEAEKEIPLSDELLDTAKEETQEREKNKSISSPFLENIRSISTVEEFKEAVKDQTVTAITLANDIDLSGVGVLDVSGKTIDLSQKTLSASNNTLFFEGIDFTIKNGTMSSKGGSYALFIGDENTTNNVLVEQVVFEGGINVYKASNVVLRNVDVAVDETIPTPGNRYYAVWCDYGGQVIVESGSFMSTGAAVLGLSENGEASLEIRGGCFLAAEGKPLVLKEQGIPVIYGGHFTEKPDSQYIAEGHCVFAASDKIYFYEVKEVNADTAVAKIEKTGTPNYYPTLFAAFEAVEDDDTIEMLRDTKIDVVEEGSIAISSKKAITLDLAGKVITVTRTDDPDPGDKNQIKHGFCLSGGASLAIKDSAGGGGIHVDRVKRIRLFEVNGGKLVFESGRYTSDSWWHSDTKHYGENIVDVVGSVDSAATNYSVVTVNEDAVVEYTSTENGGGGGCYNIAVFGVGSGAALAYGAVVNIYGQVKAGRGGDEEGGALTVSGNIRTPKADNIPQVNIYEGSELEGQIYAAGYAQWNISGGTLTGDNPLSIKAGIWNISGGTIHATGEFVDPITAVNSASEETGAAMGITSTYNKLVGAEPIEVNISGGTLSSLNGCALYVGHSKSSGIPNLFTAGVTVKITGGNFAQGSDAKARSIYFADEIEGDNKSKYSIALSDGYYTDEPNANYIAKGYRTIPSDKVGYLRTIDEAANDSDDIKIVVDVKKTTFDRGTISPEDWNVIQDTAESVTAINISRLVNAFANTITEAEMQVYANALRDLLSEPTAEVFIHAQANMDVKGVSYDSETKITELDITLLYQLIASTEKDPNNIRTEDPNKNAIKVGGLEELPVDGAVQLSLDIPNSALSDTSTTYYVRHEKSSESVYYYQLTLGELAGTHTPATFTNPNGFSFFSFPISGVVWAAFDETNETRGFSAADIEISLPTVSKEGSVFDGWKIGDVIYAKVTEEFLTALAGSTEEDPVLAAAQFSPIPSERYSITVEEAQNGTVVADKGTAPEGETIALTLTPDEGYKVEGVSVIDEKGDEIAVVLESAGKYSFTMPASNVTAKAQFGPFQPAPTYLITVEEAQHGVIVANKSIAAKGETVTLSLTPDEGYKIETVSVRDENGNELNLVFDDNNSYHFVMPASNVTAKASFAKIDNGGSDPKKTPKTGDDVASLLLLLVIGSSFMSMSAALYSRRRVCQKKL